MKKIALAVMLLATSTFGAAVVTAPSTVAVNEAGIATVTLEVAMDDLVQAVGLYAVADQANAVSVQSWQKHHPVLSDGPAVDPTTMGFFSTDMGAPTGCFGFVGSTGSNAAGPLITLDLKVEPTATFPVTVTWMGDWADPSAASDYWQPVSTVITPEPASMLLLAAGAAFFGRRRRA